MRQRPTPRHQGAKNPVTHSSPPAWVTDGRRIHLQTALLVGCEYVAAVAYLTDVVASPTPHVARTIDGAGVVGAGGDSGDLVEAHHSCGRTLDRLNASKLSSANCAKLVISPTPQRPVVGRRAGVRRAEAHRRHLGAEALDEDGLEQVLVARPGFAMIVVAPAPKLPSPRQRTHSLAVRNDVSDVGTDDDGALGPALNGEVAR